jgi:FkbM family methyltransferase
MTTPSRRSSLADLGKQLIKSDILYDILVTRFADLLLTKRTLKLTRIQLSSIRLRFGTGVRDYTLPGGARLEFELSDDLDAFMYDHLVRYGNYEAEVGSALSELITRGTTFVDVGANIGYFTVLFSRLAQTVYAFEPAPSVFRHLERNVRLNRLPNVLASQLAVSDRKKTMTLYESEISAGHDSSIRRSEHDRSTTVEAVSLDETIAPSPDIVMKVDVEGAEMGVIMGASRLIASGKVSAIIVESARGLYPYVANLRERFSLYSSIGTIEVLDDPRGRRVVHDRHELPDICNLLIRVRR